MAISKEIKWAPDNFELQTNTIWSFPDRGIWATHNPKYRGNWSPYIPRNLILRYSQEKDILLDQFAGSGTTLIEAKLLNRDIVGVDINQNALDLCKEAVKFNHDNCGQVTIKKGDARKLEFIKDQNIDFICTHPPYANIIQYSKKTEGDLSHCKVSEFLEQMKMVARESYRVLKQDKFCAILMGDTRQKGHIIPMSFDVMKTFESVGFKTKEIIIKQQHNCKTTGYWKTSSIKYNFLLIAHEYLFVFKK
jgi:DNA modification methylase